MYSWASSDTIAPWKQESFSWALDSWLIPAENSTAYPFFIVYLYSHFFWDFYSLTLPKTGALHYSAQYVSDLTFPSFFFFFFQMNIFICFSPMRTFLQSFLTSFCSAKELIALRLKQRWMGPFERLFKCCLLASHNLMWPPALFKIVQDNYVKEGRSNILITTLQ